MSYELRTYTAPEGKMDALLRRFREHTTHLFPEHGIHNVGYWIADEDPNVLIYLIRHEGDPEANWKQFRADPRWIEARDASLADGPLTSNVTSAFLTPTDFSPLGQEAAAGGA